MKTSDYESRCGNCHAYMIKSDLFCRYCGTKRGDGAFEPFDELEFVQYAYGPPIKTRFKFDACGHNWETTVFGGDDSMFCPHCGKSALQKVERTILNFENAFSLPDEEDSVPDTE